MAHSLWMGHNLPCCTTSVESPAPTHTVKIPQEYHDLMVAFNKYRATHLPPHRPWDCTIDLLPNTSPPKSRIYQLSLLETAEDYIEEAKKWGFHCNTIKFLENVISNLGVKMNNAKVKEWPAPSSIKALQHCVGFTNSYRSFIHDYSSIATPLTALLQGKPKKLNWSANAQMALKNLSGVSLLSPLGLLEPLPIPQCLWSRMAIKFITNLPSWFWPLIASPNVEDLLHYLGAGTQSIDAFLLLWEIVAPVKLC